MPRKCSHTLSNITQVLVKISINRSKFGQGLEHLSCEKSLGELVLFSLEKTQLWMNLNVVLNYLMEGNREQGARVLKEE